jgi:hypothetical protein
MEPHPQIVQAMQYCPYKAWQLSKNPASENEETDFKPIAKLLAETTALS